MRYLADTNVISEVVKKRPNPGVIQFLQNNKIFISCVVLTELNYGACRLRHDLHRRKKYMTFTEKIKQQYQQTTLPVSIEIAELSGRMKADEERQGRVLEMMDALIAATAATTGMTLATRNTKDFENLNIPLLNPFSPE